MIIYPRYPFASSATGVSVVAELDFPIRMMQHSIHDSHLRGVMDTECSHYWVLADIGTKTIGECKYCHTKKDYGMPAYDDTHLWTNQARAQASKGGHISKRGKNAKPPA